MVKNSDSAARDFMLQNNLNPLEDYPGGHKPWKCECLICHRIVSPHYSSVKQGRKGCKYCAKRAVDPEDAVTAMRKRGFKTLKPYPGAVEPWLVQCLTCKREFESVFHSLKTKTKCKYCSNVAVDEHDLLKRLKELKLKPLEKYKSAKTPWKCKCLKCGNIVYPHYTDLTQGQGGCSNCAQYGINYADKGYLYLISNPYLGAHKIGIANLNSQKKTSDRVYKHKKQGWKIYKTKNFMTAKRAYAVEQKLLYWLRVEVNLEVYLSDHQMPQGGWTETVDASEIDLPTIWAKVEELSRVKR
jgi:hypothetical protein